MPMCISDGPMIDYTWQLVGLISQADDWLVDQAYNMSIFDCHFSWPT